MYNIGGPGRAHFLVRPPKGLLPLSFDAPLVTEYWDDDASTEFEAMYKRIEAEGGVLLKR